LSNDRIVIIIICAVFALLQMTIVGKARRVGVAEVLTYNSIWKGMTKLFWLFPVAIAVINFYSPPSAAERWLPVWIILGFCALCLPITLEVFQRQIELTDQGISQKSAWSKPVKIAWKDVREVVWKVVAMEVEVRPKSGRSIRVNAWLSGMETFAEVLEKRLGHLPSIPKVVNNIRAHLNTSPRVKW
jgi:hypothetical protein